MQTVPYSQIVTPERSAGAHERRDFPGFHEDYLALHCLIQKFKPATFMEIGTSDGGGTQVICTAMEGRPVFSIENEREINRERVGKNCRLPFQQLIGDSTEADFTPVLPLEGWFIDGDHSFESVRCDSIQAGGTGAKLIVWHDLQLSEVARALNWFQYQMARGTSKYSDLYDFFRVDGTRIAFAVRKP